MYIKCSYNILGRTCENSCAITHISQIYTTDPRPPILPHVVTWSAMGINLGVFGFLPTTRAKTNAKQIGSQFFAHRAGFNVWLSSCSDCSTCRQHTHLTIHNYFDYRKTRKPPSWARCWDQDGTDSGISGVPVAHIHIFFYFVKSIHFGV